MKPRRPRIVPNDLRPRLEAARLEALALFRTLDGLGLTADEIPQNLLHELFELDADFAEALWALDQPAGRLNLSAMVRDTLVSLEQWPATSTLLHDALPARARRAVAQQITKVVQALTTKDAYAGVPGRDPKAAGPQLR